MRTVLAGATMVAVFAVLSPSTVTASVRVSAVDVVRCPTQFGVRGPVRRTPATVNITSSSSTRGLVAYTDTESYLVGPLLRWCGRRRHLRDRRVASRAGA